MKKTTKLTPKKLETAIESLYQNMGSTNDLYKVNQSINQKVERSEEDVKKRFNEIMIPFLVFQVLNFLLLLTLVVR